MRLVIVDVERLRRIALDFHEVWITLSHIDRNNAHRELLGRSMPSVDALEDIIHSADLEPDEP